MYSIGEKRRFKWSNGRRKRENGEGRRRRAAGLFFRNTQGLILAFLLQGFSPYLSPSLLFSLFLLSFAPAPSPVLSLCTHYYHLFAQAGKSADLCSGRQQRAFSVLPFFGREKGALFRTKMYK